MKDWRWSRAAGEAALFLKRQWRKLGIMNEEASANVTIIITVEEQRGNHSFVFKSESLGLTKTGEADLGWTFH